jgi:glutaredoxin
MGRRRKVAKIKVYVAQHCEPCKEVKDLLESGHFLVDGQESEIDLIDIESEEGFPLAQSQGLTSVPQAFSGDKQCRIKIDDETKTLLIECGDGEPNPSS